MIRRIASLATLMVVLAGPARSGAAGLETTDVFVSGTDGYHTYRIPAIVMTTNGTALAFCEGRKHNGGDTGAIDLLLKRSTDDGRTWGKQQVIWTDAENTCGNPAPVVDRTTGVIWLLMTWNRGDEGEKKINAGTSADTRRVYITHSDDDGKTWAKPDEITSEVKKTNWMWYATGPVNGIQLTRGSHAGRLMIPANHTEMGADGKMETRSQIIYSDDHGATWHLGGVEDKFTNESTVVERADGSLLHNMRSNHGGHRRAVATSTDGGMTWSPVKPDEALIEPVCEGALLRGTWPDNGQKSRILFSNPASEKRERMTVRISYDEGVTWPVAKLLHAGPSAYSCLTMLPGGVVGCLYECGEKRPYEKIVFARMPLTWLEDPKDPKESTVMTQTPSPSTSVTDETLNWRQLPPIPDAKGFAGPLAGVSEGALIVAGGANFPDKMPWEGGQKVWHDSVFVLPASGQHWLTGFKLPQPIGYGVSVTTPKGVLCAGGSNAHGHSRDVFRLKWNNGRLEIESLPPLPKPMANGCGALVDDTLYVAGGLETPEATNTLKTFWALDLDDPVLKWRELAPWPGPGRMLAVAGAYHETFYLFSGAELYPDAQGKPVRRYLTDAYSFNPVTGWKRLADLPRAAVAAPSPAIDKDGQLLIVSGDDGKLVNFEPKSKHPGFPKDILAYHPELDQWTIKAESPLSRATAAMVVWNNDAVIINGEVRPGYRTPQVWGLDLL
jgi:sialidase-1